MSLRPPHKVQKLRVVLHAKAKESADCRFHSLYDKVYRGDVLAYAYARCKANKGAAGVDGQAFADVEAYGVERWLDELAQELREKTYRPEAVRRVYIPKPDGKQRPLGIPTVKDRVAQMATVIVLEPIFEADLLPEQYAYRPGRSAHDAIRHVHKLVSTGRNEVVDADLSGYFDSVPHAELMQCLARRISDGAMLHLLKMWLEQPVEEEDERGHKHRTTRNRDEKRGTPQGAPISPLLANLYMRRFVLGWRTLGHERRLGASIVNYADDFVICCPRGTADEAMAAMRGMMAKLKLTVNESKTRTCMLPEETFDFLGYTYGQCYSWKNGRPYIGIRPSRKRMARVRQVIREMTRRTHVQESVEERVSQLNRVLVGWRNYFCMGTVSKPYRHVDLHVRWRLRQWLRAKHGQARIDYREYPDAYLHGDLGLVRLAAPRRNVPCAYA